jgi:hypothetical protein
MNTLLCSLSATVGLIVMSGLAVAEDAHAPQSQDVAVHVANNGIDAATCGARDDPCRSITQAIANAKAGDTLLVGPGRYGDVNGNDVPGEPGEEMPAAECRCAVHINKRIHLLSRGGAAVTLIDAGGASNAVEIATDGATLGAPRMGFGIANADALGLGVLVSANRNVTVAGNVVTGGGAGYGVRSAASGTPDGVLIVTYGFDHRFIGNIAVGTRDEGFSIHGQGHRVIGNMAIATVYGFRLGGRGLLIRSNVATSNESGFEMSSFNDTSFILNSAIANETYGLLFVAPPIRNLTVRRNNFYGNGCGISNGSTVSLSVIHNYWGAATGPGPDPADETCGPSGLITEPFATHEFDTGRAAHALGD